ncbi:MAG: metalloprotease [Halalkalicoccus sp.]
MSTTIGSIRFGSREVRDLLIAWVALGIAFALFFAGGAAGVRRGDFLTLLIISMLTAGVGFLLHEIAHKVVAVRFGQRAAFKADYGMLLLAILSATAGFIFAAPGAVYHRGRITKRENGLIAVAGPVTNLVLALAFAPLLFVPVDFIARLGLYGVGINLLLAAFNMIPFGPLDGKTVLAWSKPAFLLTFAVSVGLAVGAAVFFLF